MTTPTPPVRIIVGASSQDYPGWVRTQQDDLDLRRRADWDRMFLPGSIRTILAEHVWEHLDDDEARLAAANCFAFLEDGGYVRCAVPDGLFPNEAYQRTVRIGGPGPADHPAATHRSLFTWRTLTAVFQSAGFTVCLLEWWDDDGQFQRRDWDASDGFIYRSFRFDHRNQHGELGFMSLIVDAIKRERTGIREDRSETKESYMSVKRFATPSGYDALTHDLAERGVDVAAVEASLRQQRIETPSWAYGNSGTRFRVFSQPGVPRTPYEKFADAAEVHRLTGVCPSVAIHIPWDQVDDFGALRDYAASVGLTIGAINPNLFQDEAYRLGSLCHPDAAIRRQATDHLLACNAIAREVGSDLITLWLADGTNYAGQDSFIERRHRLVDALREPYADLHDGQRLLVEYKFFEPAFYHTDLADWGMALTLCQKLGPQADVLVDLGHHAQGVNVEHIVALLIDEGRLGGFHFNSRKYADDDLIVGSTNPFELFLIYVELVGAGAAATDRIAYMIDQSFNVESKIEGMLLSVTNLQEALARALLVDRSALAAAQAAGDVLGAHRIMLDAFQTDVRPLTAKVRLDLGGEADPIATFRASGYTGRVAAERAGGTAMSWT